MATHLYLSLIPEALIASMLTPEEFVVYYAVGSAKKSRGQAIFFEVDPDFRHDFFRIDEGFRRCVPHEDGSPKRSIYIAVYRVLEHMALGALQRLYLVTQDGRSLGLEPTTAPHDTDGLHLYQEVAPVHPLVVSTLGPSSSSGKASTGSDTKTTAWGFPIESRQSDNSVRPSSRR